MQITITSELIEHLQKLATRKTWEDDPDFDLASYCGGNYDDAFQRGQDDGATDLARHILNTLGVAYDHPSD